MSASYIDPQNIFYPRYGETKSVADELIKSNEAVNGGGIYTAAIPYSSRKG